MPNLNNSWKLPPKMYIGFIIAGVVCFLFAGTLFLVVMNWRECGVTKFSAQVSASDRLGFFSISAAPAGLGVLMFPFAWLSRPRKR
jgi:hypothetical protein